jgi:hypothetical protein
MCIICIDLHSGISWLVTNGISMYFMVFHIISWYFDVLRCFQQKIWKKNIVK